MTISNHGEDFEREIAVELADISNRVERVRKMLVRRGADTTPCATSHETTTTDSPSWRRRSVIEPLLQKRGLSPARWAKDAGLDPSVAYDYLKGRRCLRSSSRAALARVLGLPVDSVPA